MTSRIVLFLWCLPFFPSAVAALDQNEEETYSSKPIYVSMLPHFLINLADNQGRHFMQMKAKTLVVDKATEGALKKHMPAVRHNILMKLSHLRPRDVRNSDQMEELRQELTEIIRTTLLDLSGNEGVKGLYISSVVIQ